MGECYFCLSAYCTDNSCREPDISELESEAMNNG